MSDERSRQEFVSIVGRPNVGKSTLFNRMVGRQRTLTGDEPGITRDRISEPLEWEDTRFTLVDTAGYTEQHPAPDSEHVLEQVEEMIDLSSLILFVVDIQDSLHPLDKEIARKLYSVSDRVLLVGNKADDSKHEHNLSDFYELGFSDIIPVSAVHKRNLDRLRKLIIERLPGSEQQRPSDIIRVSLVGRPNVGKSTFFNQVLGYDRVMVDDERGTTRDVVSVRFQALNHQFELMDTVGLDRHPERAGETLTTTTLRAVHFSHVVGLMVDYHQRITNQDQRLAGFLHDAYRGGLIMINKAEQREESVDNRWLEHVEDRLNFIPEAPVLFTSGLEGKGIKPFFEAVVDIHEQMHRWIEPNELQNSFLDIKPRISWSSREARQVRLQTIEQVDVDPPSFTITAVRANELRPPDLRHLKSLLREQLDLPHCPIKLRITDSAHEEEPVS